MKIKQKIKILSFAVIATCSLLFFYFLIVSSISGWKFTQDQFVMFWYFIIGTALLFGVQIGLFTYLKELIRYNSMSASPQIVALTGTTSTLSMISCCAHYLVNIVPIFGITGALSFVALYQIEIFWVGIVFNLIGIVFIVNRIIKFKRNI